MNAQQLGTIFILISALSFAAFPILINYAFAYGINVPTMLAFRFLGAAIFLWAALWFRKIPAAVSRRDAIYLILMGILGYGSMSTLYSSSLHYLPPSMTAMLLYLYPIIVTVISFFLGDETFDYRRWVALIISGLGLFLVLGATWEKFDMIGILLASGAAFVYSAYIIAGNRLLKNVSPFVTTAYITLSASVAFFLIGTLTGNLMLNIAAPGWLILLFIALIPTVTAILTFFAGMARIGPSKASIISTIEPVCTVLLSAWLLGERFTVPQLIGGSLVLCGIVLIQVWTGAGSGEPVSSKD
jgi:drug/metabolite transporter (DMT)-like permease